jgi:hypothetical protein
MVHLIPSWMRGISRLVSFSKYLILQFLDARHTNLSLVPQHTLVIFHKFELLFCLIALYPLDLLIFHLHNFCIGYNPQIELVELFEQLERYILHFHLTHMRHLTPSVSYHVGFSRMVVYSKTIILDKL